MDWCEKITNAYSKWGKSTLKNEHLVIPFVCEGHPGAWEARTRMGCKLLVPAERPKPSLRTLTVLKLPTSYYSGRLDPRDVLHCLRRWGRECSQQ